MPTFKNPIAWRLARWLTAGTSLPKPFPVSHDHVLMDDLAAGADEIERLTELLRQSEHNLANIIRTG